FWPRQGLRIEILPRTQHRNIGLWFGVVSELNRVLDADNRSVSNLTTQERIEPVDNCDMAWTDGTHRTHLAINQFDTVIFCQNARLYHAGEVGNSKLPAENLDSHISSRHKRM